MPETKKRIPKRPPTICQFKISLLGISPTIWRRILVPESYTFWDLHVAIQDAMGWLDYHLHQYRIFDFFTEEIVQFGIPFDDIGDDGIEPSWDAEIDAYFIDPGDEGIYEYDFGDGWQHEVLLEGVFLGEIGVKYPKCIGGEMACPPEDCGGIGGYENLLNILKNPKDEEHEFMVDWLKSHEKKYYPFDPAAFDAEKVRFDNPKKRWRQAFSDT
ncbi:MAG: plasmid pRiA4b ORF-3 family protein [Pyrinomonadaceae bacterium]